MNTIHQQLLTRPTYVEVNMASLRHNFQVMKSLAADSKILCTVKGNAYGHGAVKVATLFQELGADYLGVALPEEGVELRKAGISIPILVLSAIADQQIRLCIEHNLSLTAPSFERVERINEVARELDSKAGIHIKIDTGMSRIGVHFSRVEKFFPILHKARHIELEGIYSHFSVADEDEEYSRTQLERFLSACKKFEDEGFAFALKHIANSAATMFYPESHLDMVRIGLALYGLSEGRLLPEEIVLKPALTWKTQVSYFKSIAKGTALGYGHRFVAREDTRIATLTVGYADGYQRAMGEKGSVIIRDHRYPIVGTVCMDQMMVNLRSDGEAYVGDTVILVGSSPSHSISLYDIARTSNTSVYELLCQISYRVRREYVDL